MFPKRTDRPQRRRRRGDRCRRRRGGARTPRAGHHRPHRLWRPRRRRRVHGRRRSRRPLEHSVRIGAHPSYPDRERFRPPPDGDRPRRTPRLAERAAAGARPRLPRRPAPRIESVKAHGALYEEVAKGGAVYEDVPRRACATTTATNTAVVLPSGCRAMAMVLRDGVVASEEGFCDRAYRPDGALVDRGAPGAVLSDPEEAAAQAPASPAARRWPSTAACSPCGWTRCASTVTPRAPWRSRPRSVRLWRERGSTWPHRRVRDTLHPRRGGAAPR